MSKNIPHNVQELIDAEKHEEILGLDSPTYDKYKIVACIFLGRYRDALIYCTENTFEKAYCFYKLKNFKRSLKVLNKLSGQNVECLRAQCLYFIGRYSESHEIMSKFPNRDEIAVNMSAIESLNVLSQSNGIFSYKPDRKITTKSEPFFNKAECLMESEFNQCFEFIEEEWVYSAKLEEMDEKYKEIENSYFKKQQAIMENEDMESFTKNQREIYNFNTQVGGMIENPVHFQNNFCGEENTEYKVSIKGTCKNTSTAAKTHAFTKKIVLQHVVAVLEARGIHPNKIEATISWAIKKLKEFEREDTTKEIKMLEMLQKDEKDAAFQKETKELFKILKK